MKIDNMSNNIISSQTGTSQPITSQEARDTQSIDKLAKDLNVKKVANEKQANEKNDDVINDELLENAVKQANKTLEIYSKYIERTVHEKTHTIMYALKDAETKEIIREFPPKKIQDMIAKMWEMAGIIVDERR